ncbi:POC1 centriolar protein A, partial [Cladochytrium tenue]
IWSTYRTKFQFTLAGHLNWVRTARFSPDFRLVVSGSDDKTVKLWDLRSKMCTKTYFDHTGMITSVAFHPGGTVVASCSTDKTIKLFDVRTHKLLQHYSDAHAVPGSSGETSGGPTSIAFGGLAGEWLISSGMDGLVKIWDLKEGHLFYTLHGHKYGPTTAATFSPDGKSFATGGSDAQVMVWQSNFDFDSLRTDEGLDPIPVASFATRKTKSTAIGGRDGDAATGETRSPAYLRPPSRLGASPDQEIVDVGAPMVPDPVAAHPDYSSAAPAAGLGENAGGLEGDGEHYAYTASLGVRNTPDDIANVLQHLVGQIDVLTQTVRILEERLTLTEDRLAEALQARTAAHTNPHMGPSMF